MPRRVPLLGLSREPIFSPQREQADATILHLTGEALARRGFPVEIIPGEALPERQIPPLIFTMSRDRSLLQALKKYEAEGTLVINAPHAILNCYRTTMLSLLTQHASIPFPPSQLIQVERFLEEWEAKKRQPNLADASWECGLWVKRGDVHAMQRADVSFVRHAEALQRVLQDFQNRGITEAIFQQHIEGTVVKFYALAGEPLLDWFLTHGELPHEFPSDQLTALAHQAASILGLEVYGGDGILTREGAMYLIDLNDWPSFSPCQPRAADAIARYILQKMHLRCLQ